LYSVFFDSLMNSSGGAEMVDGGGDEETEREAVMRR
jgi:hypothetical protein